MKLVIPGVESVILQGRQEEVKKQDTWPHQRQPVDGDFSDATKSGQNLSRLHKEGKTTRAVVCHVDDENEMFDPRNWGIVIDISPYHPKQLVVHWVNREKGLSHSDGSDLLVIYPGVTKGSIIQWVHMGDRSGRPVL